MPRDCAAGSDRDEAKNSACGQHPPGEGCMGLHLLPKPWALVT